MLSLRVLSFSGQEDIEEIIEKILSSKADTISLVFPREAYIFQQKTDLQKLRDVTDREEKNITIVTLNAKARKEIQSIGISAVPTLADNEETPFEKARESLEKLQISYIPIDTNYQKKNIKHEGPEINPFLSKPTLHALFILAFIACLLFFFILQIAVPAANVEISPTKKEEEMHINVNFFDVSTHKESDLWEKNNGLFMFPIESTFVHEGRFTNVSKKFYGENAKGTLQLVNNTDEEITLKKGTRIAHEKGLVLLLPEWEKIPAKSNIIIPLTMPPKDVYGTIVGERGNLEKGEKFLIPGLPDSLQKDVFAQVDDSFEGGVNIWKYHIAQKDFARAKKVWEEEARKKIKNEIERKFKELQEKEENKNKEFRLIIPSEKSIEFEVISYAFTEDPESLIGKEQGFIDGQIQVRIKTYVYDTEHLLDLIRSKFQKLAPDGMILQSINKDLLVSHIQFVSQKNNIIKASFSTRGIYEYSLEPKSDKSRLFLMQAKKAIMGETKEDAQEILINGFIPIADVEITLSPFWVQSLPVIPEKIQFTITDF